MFTRIPKQTSQIISAGYLTIIAVFYLSPIQAQYDDAVIERLLATPKTYSVYKTDIKIHIDGKPDEQVWQHTPWTDAFVDIEGDVRSAPLYETRVKMLWDDHHLYIYAQLEEPHIWGTIDQHDAIIYHDNDFEVFIKNTEYGSTYYEVEVNTLGTILDLFMPAPYRAGGKALISWDIRGLQKAVYINGSLNNPSDIDRFWAVEMAIPFAEITSFGQRPTPRTNDIWRINFSRVQWQHDIVDGSYLRKVDEQGKPLPEYNWVWSPQGIVDMHAPERWGYIRFDERMPDAGNPSTFDIPISEQVKQRAWLVHYLQTTYRRLHGTYAPTLEELGEQWASKLAGYQLELSAGKDWYVAKIYAEQEQLCFSINQHGQLNPSSLDRY